MIRSLKNIQERKIERYAARVVHRLRRIPSADWQPDEYPCRHLWDHWKLERQRDESFAHDLIEQAVALKVGAVVENLPPDEVEFLSLDLEHFEDSGEVILLDQNEVAGLILDRVNEIALNEPHRREVQDRLDLAARDRAERDLWG